MNIERSLPFMAEDQDKFTSAVATVRLVTTKQISPVEVTKPAIERIQLRNPSLNAVVYSDFEGAIARAHALEARIMRGEAIGPSHACRH
jgi:amidase